MTTNIDYRSLQIGREQSIASLDYEKYKKRMEAKTGEFTLEDLLISDIMRGSHNEFNMLMESHFFKGDKAELGFLQFIKAAYNKFWEEKLNGRSPYDFDSELPRITEEPEDKIYWFIDAGENDSYTFKLGQLKSKRVSTGSVIRYNPNARKNKFSVMRPSSPEVLALDPDTTPIHKPSLPLWLDPTGFLHQLIVMAILEGMGEDGAQLASIQKRVFDKISTYFNIIDCEDEEGYPLPSVIACNSTMIVLIMEAVNNSHIFKSNSTGFDSKKFTFTDSYKEKNKLDKENLKFRYVSYEPCVCEPNNHVDLVSPSGGYLIKRSALLKNPLKVFEEEVPLWDSVIEIHNSDYEKTVSDFEIKKGEESKKKVIHPLISSVDYESNPYLFDSINKRQDCKYKVNSDMLEIYPLILNELGKVFGSKKLRRKLPAFERTIDMAQMYKDFPAIYFPLFFDPRDRFYPYCTNSLSYQGDDLGKSLTTFANGRKLDDGITDYIKLCLAEHITVRDEQGNKINAAKKIDSVKLELVNSVLPYYLDCVDNNDFSFISKEGIEEPFVFVAALRDLSAALKDPEHLSCFIYHNDSCASGMQIMGVASGCYETMRMTNVINPKGEDLADVYLEIMNDAYDYVKGVACGDIEVEIPSNKAIPRSLREKFKKRADYHNYLKLERILICNRLMEFPSLFEDRKVIKTPAMTRINYEATVSSCFNHIITRLYENHEEAFEAIMVDNKYRPFIQNLKDIFSKPSFENLEDLPDEEYNEIADELGDEIQSEILESDYKPKKKDDDSDIKVIDVRFSELRGFCQIFWEIIEKKNPTINAIKKWIGNLIEHTCNTYGSFGFINPMNGFPVAMRKDTFLGALIKEKKRFKLTKESEVAEILSDIVKMHHPEVKLKKITIKNFLPQLEKEELLNDALINIFFEFNKTLQQTLEENQATDSEIEKLEKLSYDKIVYYRMEFESKDGKYQPKPKATMITRQKPTGICNIRKTKSSGVPSVIHSSDGSIMLRISEPFEDFAAIHDSAGVQANDLPLLRTEVALTLKEFEQLNFFQKIAQQVGFTEPFPEPAVKYDESIHGKIEDCKYAFC